jgi:hypothetical protein
MSDISSGYLRLGANARVRDGGRPGTGKPVFSQQDHIGMAVAYALAGIDDSPFTKADMGGLAFDDGGLKSLINDEAANAAEHWHPVPTSPTELGPPEVSARDMAKGQGYTGDQCTNCNSMRMLIAGHCQVCEDCGTSTGCS